MEDSCLKEEKGETEKERDGCKEKNGEKETKEK